MQRISLLFGLLMILLPIKAQHKSDFAILEDSIIQIHKSMLSEPRMEIRYQKNEQLLYLIEEVLNKKNSFSYKFDSLKTISVLTSPNKKVRIFTWYLIDDRNNCEYFGFLQTYNEQSNRYMLYPLIDKSKRIQNPVSQKLTHNTWYGARYYRIIETKSSERVYYTLLGWNGGDVFSQFKVIDVLTISEKGVPTFGAPIFRNYSKSKHYRILFQYAKNASLHLDYGKGYFSQRSDKKDKKTKRYTYDTIPENMLIFNRLIPMDESLVGIPQYYVPETTLNDAFVEKDGRWQFKSGVQGRNEDNLQTLSPRSERIQVRSYYKSK